MKTAEEYKSFVFQVNDLLGFKFNLYQREYVKLTF